MSSTPANALVWCEIPVTDLEKSVAFYNATFNYALTIDTSGPNPMAMLPFDDDKSGTGGHLYPGKPPAKGTGLTVHLAVPDTLEETMERFKSCGGEIVSPIVQIPPGRFAYGHDPDGNSIAMFQPN